MYVDYFSGVQLEETQESQRSLQYANPEKGFRIHLPVVGYSKSQAQVYAAAATSVTRFGGHSGPAPHSKFTPLKGGPVVILDFVNLNWPEGSHRGRRELSLAVVVLPVILAWPPVILAWPSSSRPLSSPGRRDLGRRPRLAVVISPGRCDLWPGLRELGLDFVNLARLRKLSLAVMIFGCHDLFFVCRDLWLCLL